MVGERLGGSDGGRQRLGVRRGGSHQRLGRGVVGDSDEGPLVTRTGGRRPRLGRGVCSDSDGGQPPVTRARHSLGRSRRSCSPSQSLAVRGVIEDYHAELGDSIGIRFPTTQSLSPKPETPSLSLTVSYWWLSVRVAGDSPSESNHWWLPSKTRVADDFRPSQRLPVRVARGPPSESLGGFKK